MSWPPQSPRSDELVLFFSHVVTPSNPAALAILSQWYPAPFADPLYPSAHFKTSEHYMMYRKALLFSPDMCERILAAATPAEAKALGRQVRGFDRAVWDTINDGVVQRGNRLKFGRAEWPERWAALRGTVGRWLVECNADDRIWGIGYGVEDAMGHVSEWGANRMGLALTRARDEMLQEEEDEKNKATEQSQA